MRRHFFLLLLISVFSVIPISTFPLFRTEADIDRALADEAIDYEAYQVLKDLYQHPLEPCESPLDLFQVPGVTGEEVELLERLCAEDKLSAAVLPALLLEKIALFINLEELSNGAALRTRYGYSRNLNDTLNPFPRDHAFMVQGGAGPVRVFTQGKTDAWGRGYFQRNGLAASWGRTRLALGSFRKSEGLGLALGGNFRTPVHSAPDTGFRNTLFAPLSNDLFGGDLSSRFGRFRFGLFGSRQESRLFPSGENTLVGGKTEYRQGPSTTRLLLVQTQTGLSSGGPALSAQCLSISENYRTPELSLKSELAFSNEGHGLAAEGLLEGGGFGYGFGLWRYSRAFFSPTGRGPHVRLRSVTELEPEEDSLVFYELRKNEEGLSAFLLLEKNGFRARPSLAVGRNLQGETLACDIRFEADRQIPSIASELSGDFRLFIETRDSVWDRVWRPVFRMNTRISPRLELRNEVRFDGGKDTLRRTTFESGVIFLPAAFLQAEVSAWVARPRNLKGEVPPMGLTLSERLRLRDREWLRIHVRLSRNAESGLPEPSSMGLTCDLSI